MKIKTGIFKKYFVLQFLIVAIFVIVGFTEFRAGEEFQVNTYIDDRQTNPAVAMDKKGNFVITWMSYGQDGSGSGIFAQRFNKQGEALGSEFQVNTYTFGNQSWPSVAMDKKGNFVITWTSLMQDGSGNGIFAQRFNKQGEALGLEFQVNTYTDSSISWPGPSVAMDWKGNFIITWTSSGQDSSAYGVFAQRFNRKGNTVGPEFQVNTYSDNSQYYSAAAMDKKGNFVITWQSQWQDGSLEGIFAQRYNRKGNAVGSEFQVNTYIDDIQYYPAAAMDKKGNFVITWMSSGQDGSNFGVFAQRFNRKGNAVGPEFQVNTYTESAQGSPAVAMDWKGNFVIVWDSLGQDGYGGGIFGQMYNRDGKIIGSEFQVNAYTESYQALPAVAMSKKGNFVITWESSDQDGSDYGIFARMFKK